MINRFFKLWIQFTATVYCMLSFLLFELNPSNWSEGFKALFVAIGILGGIVFGFIVTLFSNDR